MNITSYYFPVYRWFMAEPSSIHFHGDVYSQPWQRTATIAGPTEAQRKLMQDPPVAGDGMGDDGSIYYSGELPSGNLR